MASSYVKVRFNDGEIMYANYQNTSDVMGDKLYHSRDECLDNNFGSDVNSKCEHSEEFIEIANHYGSGQTHTGLACRKCNEVTFDYEGWLESLEYSYGWGFSNKTEEDELNEKKINSENWIKRELPKWY